jgi:hypothetical protein
MANERIAPYPEEALALNIVPPKELVPVLPKELVLASPKLPDDHAYYAQAIPHPVIAPPPPRLLLEDKSR